MTSDAATLASGLLGLAATGGVAAVGATVARRQRTYLPGGIAIAPDGSPDPLTGPLRLGMAGLELLVRVDAEWQLRLGAGSLEHLVFEPLARRVAAAPNGRVYGGWSEPLLLLLRLDRGASGVAALVALEALVARYESLCTASAVTVLLTGPGWPPSDSAALLVEGHVDAPCGPPSAVPLVYESLAGRLGWDPREPWRELPPEARHIVRALVRQAHDEGRRLRFVEVPEKPAAVRRAMWRELHAAGVDYHSSRHAAALARFLRGGFGRPRGDRRHAAPRSRYALLGSWP